MKDLSQLRKEIDALDRQLLELLSQRMAVVAEVGAYKKAHHLPVVDMARWQEVLNSKLELAKKYQLDLTMIKDIYNRIHQAAIEMEEKLQEKE